MMPGIKIAVPNNRILAGRDFSPPLSVRDRSDVYRIAKSWVSPMDRSIVFGYEMAQMNPLPDVDW